MGYNDTHSQAIANDLGYNLRLENKVKLHMSVLKYRKINNLKSQIINFKNLFSTTKALS